MFYGLDSLDFSTWQRTRENIAEAKAEAKEGVAEAKANTELEKVELQTDVTLDWIEKLATAGLRISCLVLGIWLVKILVRKRERSIQFAAHYWALGDACLLRMGNEPKEINEFMESLVPMRQTFNDSAQSPVDDVIRILKASKRNKNE